MEDEIIMQKGDIQIRFVMWNVWNEWNVWNVCNSSDIIMTLPVCSKFYRLPLSMAITNSVIEARKKIVMRTINSCQVVCVFLHMTIAEENRTLDLLILGPTP